MSIDILAVSPLLVSYKHFLYMILKAFSGAKITMTFMLNTLLTRHLGSWRALEITFPFVNAWKGIVTK